jgi:hypothetical protein
MVGSIDPRCEILRGIHWHKTGRVVVWNSRRGNHLGQRSKPTASTGRTYRCKRSDQTSEKLLAARGPSTYGSRVALRLPGTTRMDSTVKQRVRSSQCQRTRGNPWRGTREGWIASSLALLAMTEHASAFSRHLTPEPCQNCYAFANRGRGECRVPNAPAAPCALGVVNMHTGVHSGGHRKHPAFPTQWLERLIRALPPGNRAFLPPSSAGLVRDQRT